MLFSFLSLSTPFALKKNNPISSFLGVKNGTLEVPFKIYKTITLPPPTHLYILGFGSFITQWNSIAERKDFFVQLPNIFSIFVLFFRSPLRSTDWYFFEVGFKSSKCLKWFLFTWNGLQLGKYWWRGELQKSTGSHLQLPEEEFEKGNRFQGSRLGGWPRPYLLLIWLSRLAAPFQIGFATS